MNIKHIALEGTHGSGKTTTINKFKKYQGKEVFVLDEMIRKLDGADAKNKLEKLENKLLELDRQIYDSPSRNNDKIMRGIMDTLKDLKTSVNEGSFKFHLNNYTYEDINTYFFSEDLLINLYFGLIESLRRGKQKNIYLFQENTRFLYDRCFLSPLYYMRYFMHCEETKEKLSKVNIKKLRDMYRSSVDRVCEYRHSYGFDDWLFLILKPLPLNIEDKFRIEGKEIQQNIYDICIDTLEVLDIDYIECDQQEAEEIIKETTGVKEWL